MGQNILWKLEERDLYVHDKASSISSEEEAIKFFLENFLFFVEERLADDVIRKILICETKQMQFNAGSVCSLVWLFSVSYLPNWYKCQQVSLSETSLNVSLR